MRPAVTARRLAVLVCVALFGIVDAGQAADLGPGDGPVSANPSERLLVEVAIGAMRLEPALRLVGDGQGIDGTPLDLRRDLGVPTRWRPSVGIDLRLRRHRARFEYVSITGEGGGRFDRDASFLGDTYRAGETVSSSFDWRLLRFGYEYALLRLGRVTASPTIELRDGDLTLRLASSAASGTGRSHIPMPLVGGTVRADVLPGLTVTGEVSLFAVPDNAARTFGGHFVDAAGYMSWRIRKPLAARAGIRTIDIRHLGKTNEGYGRLTGLYLGALVSF